MAGRGKKNPYKISTDVGLATIENLSGLGMTMNEIAAIIGVSRTTLYLHQRTNKEVKSAIERGRAKAIEKVAQVAYDMATDGRHPDMTKFYLKCQANWVEKQVIDVGSSTKEDEQKIESQILADMSDSELEVFEKILMKDRQLKMQAGMEPLEIEASPVEEKANNATVSADTRKNKARKSKKKTS